MNRVREENLKKKYYKSEETISDYGGWMEERLQIDWKEDLHYISNLNVINGYFSSNFGDRIYFPGFKHLECFVPKVGFDLLYKNIHKERFYRLKDNSLINYIDWDVDRFITVWGEWGSIKFIKIEEVPSTLEPKEEDLVEIDFDNTFYNNHFWSDRKGTWYNDKYIKGTNERKELDLNKAVNSGEFIKSNLDTLFPDNE